MGGTCECPMSNIKRENSLKSLPMQVSVLLHCRIKNILLQSFEKRVLELETKLNSIH